jgi:XTP/dITP diphosphohydrolase
MDLLIATTNLGKLREIQALLADAPVRCVSLRDISLDSMDVEESGDTYEANAALKAAAYASASGLFSLADDTGLEVDALDGRPGLYSHRYAGPTDRDRYEKLLGELNDVPDERRTARFICAIAVTNPQTGESDMVRGVCHGKIAWTPCGGTEGFGYDAVFLPDGADGECLAALPMEAKNAVSHRGDAARNLIPVLVRLAK